MRRNHADVLHQLVVHTRKRGMTNWMRSCVHDSSTIVLPVARVRHALRQCRRWGVYERGLPQHTHFFLPE